MADHIETDDVIDLVEHYVTRELADADRYSNRTPLDESGVYDLHRLAADIYARGFHAGERASTMRESRSRARAKDRATVPEVTG